MAAGDKNEALVELVKVLNDQGLLSDYDAVLEAVMEREAVRSTGIGQGLGVPHGKSAAVDRLVGVMGRLAEPIEFDSIDRQPVSMLVMLISPINKTGPHIQALACIGRLMSDDELRERLWAADSAEQLYQVILAHDRNNPM